MDMHRLGRLTHYDLMAALTKFVHEPCLDESATANDYDFHITLSMLRRKSGVVEAGRPQVKPACLGVTP